MDLHRESLLPADTWRDTRGHVLSESTMDANTKGVGRGPGRSDSYLAGTWRWNAAGPLVAPGDTADIFRLKLGFC